MGDHFNDCVTNLIALTCSELSGRYKSISWLDQVGGIIISLYVIVSWGSLIQTGVNEIVGKEAKVNTRIQALKIVKHILLEFSKTREIKMSIKQFVIIRDGQRHDVELTIYIPSKCSLLFYAEAKLKVKRGLKKLPELKHVFIDFQLTRPKKIWTGCINLEKT